MNKINEHGKTKDYAYQLSMHSESQDKRSILLAKSTGFKLVAYFDFNVMKYSALDL